LSLVTIAGAVDRQQRIVTEMLLYSSSQTLASDCTCHCSVVN